MSAYDYNERSPLGERGKTVLPASEFLQERLQERRARNTRPKRARHTDIGPRPGRDDDIFFAEAEDGRNSRMFDSSPMIASARGSDAGGQSSDRRRRTLGVRDMDDQMDRLNKQNFALKLELDHRRKHALEMRSEIDSMKEQVERAVALEDEHKELLRINSQLVQELEKRDRAVEEAMDIICELEDKVSDLEERHSNTRPSTAHADSGYAGTETHDQEPPSSPPDASTISKSNTAIVRAPAAPTTTATAQLQSLLSSQTPAKSKREPSILSSKKPSTNALRSVYLANAKSLHPVKSFHSLLSRHESKTEEETAEPDSPRLSVLSESSFPSIYSPKPHVSPEQYAWEEDDDEDTRSASIGSRAHLRQDSIKRVSQWISEKDAADATPSKSNNLSDPLQLDDEAISTSTTLSGNKAAPQQYHSSDDALSAAVTSPSLAPAADFSSTRPRLRHQKAKKTPGPLNSFAGPIFGEQMLPPTPDSASTRMLRASRSSIADDRSLLDSTPAAVKGFNALEPGIRTAPRQMRSSVELSSAYASNLHFRHDAFDGTNHNSADSSEQEFEDDARSETVKDFGIDLDDLPVSVKMGTPSRFMSHGKPPEDSMFNHNNVSPTFKAKSPHRRRSSDQFTASTAKPRLDRMETSPSILGRIMSNGGKSSVESVTSPHSSSRSHHSGSSNRTIVQADEHSNRALSPEGPRTTSQLSSSVASPPRNRASPSPARSFGKNLLRRMSTGRSEKSPLPTLTSTPSSAYVQDLPARPKTSFADRPSKGGDGSTASRPPSSREARRPSLTTRTKTEPAAARPGSAAGLQKEKRSIFGRSNSVKNANKADPVPNHPNQQEGRGVPPNRRGSLRDAVTSRRPWR